MSGATSADEFLTVEEVARLLKVNPQTVRNWISRRELAAVRGVGARRVRVRRSDLDAFVAAGSPAADGGQPASDLELKVERLELAKALDGAKRALGGADDDDLARAVRALARAANQLARALERSSGYAG